MKNKYRNKFTSFDSVTDREIYEYNEDKRIQLIMASY